MASDLVAALRAPHIVAHSHGGNVVLHALRSVADDPKKLGAVIFLGTPVLHFSPPRLNRSSVAMLFYGVGLIYGIIAKLYVRFYPEDPLADDVLLAHILTEGLPPTTDVVLRAGGLDAPIATVCGLLFLDEWLARRQRHLPLCGSGHAHAFEFAGDEAMKALQLVIEVTQRPGDVLKQLFSTKAPPEYAVRQHRPKFWKVFWTDFKKTAVYRPLNVVWSGLPEQSSAQVLAPTNPVSANNIPSRATRQKTAVETLVSILSFLSQAARRNDVVKILVQ
jgi:hypothetical protein